MDESEGSLLVGAEKLKPSQALPTRPPGRAPPPMQCGAATVRLALARGTGLEPADKPFVWEVLGNPAQGCFPN